MDNKDIVIKDISFCGYPDKLYGEFDVSVNKEFIARLQKEDDTQKTVENYDKDNVIVDVYTNGDILVLYDESYWENLEHCDFIVSNETLNTFKSKLLENENFRNTYESIIGKDKPKEKADIEKD